MHRSLLPLNALRYFEATARNRSLTRAAEELHVTHAAVSHQIRALEELTGRKLFHRQSHGVVPTDIAETMLPAISKAFDMMEETMTFLSDTPDTAKLRITTTPTFASAWLIPKLKGFRARWESIGVQITPSLDLVDIANGSADIAIRCGQPPWGTLACEFMLPIHLTPVCSPSLFGGPERAPGHPRDLLGHQMILSDAPNRPLGEEWKMWCAAAGVDFPDNSSGSVIHDPGLGLQAALNGFGVAIGYEELIQDLLADGRLIRPIDISVRHELSYYLVWDPKRSADRSLSVFRAWIQDEVLKTSRCPDG